MEQATSLPKFHAVGSHRPQRAVHLQHSPGAAQQLPPRRRPAQSQLDDAHMGQAIRTVFQQRRRRYGHRRIWKQLATLQPRTLYAANQRWTR
ncbi:MAG: IS3 family transposase [Verrucomicrobiaceae bacterium]|nr:IS3 family transposase [Verrucomicrobiaceae bacterium]